jgi:hypothetical protein
MLIHVGLKLKEELYSYKYGKMKAYHQLGKQVSFVSFIKKETNLSAIITKV